MVSKLIILYWHFSDDWIDCARASSATLSILTKLHPMHVIPDVELSDDAKYSSPTIQSAKQKQGKEFDATVMEPDVVYVHVDVAAITGCASGSIIRALLTFRVRVNAC